MDEMLAPFIGVGTGGIIAAFIGWIVLSSLKKNFTNNDKIPQLEARIGILEQQAIAHNETKDAVIRMEEQIKFLARQVQQLSDLLMGKVLNNNG